MDAISASAPNNKVVMGVIRANGGTHPKTHRGARLSGWTGHPEVNHLQIERFR